jgi:hypothetical protein
VSACIFCAPNFEAPSFIAPPVFDLAPKPADPAGCTGRGRVAAAAELPADAPNCGLAAPLPLLARPVPTPPLLLGLLTLPKEPAAAPRLSSIASQPPPSSTASQPLAAAAAPAALGGPPPLLLVRVAAGLLLLLLVVVLAAGRVAAAGLDDMLRRLNRLRACT